MNTTPPNRSLALFLVTLLFLPLAGCDPNKTSTGAAALPTTSASTAAVDPHAEARRQLDSQNFGSALQLAEQGLAKDDHDFDFHLIKLVVLTQTQRLDTAIPALEAMLRAGFKNISLIDRDTRLDALRKDPRYADLLGRYKLDDVRTAISAGNAAVKVQEDGSGEVRAGDVVIKIPKD